MQRDIDSVGPAPALRAEIEAILEDYFLIVAANKSGITVTLHLTCASRVQAPQPTINAHPLQ